MFDWLVLPQLTDGLCLRLLYSRLTLCKCQSRASYRPSRECTAQSKRYYTAKYIVPVDELNLGCSPAAARSLKSNLVGSFCISDLERSFPGSSSILPTSFKSLPLRYTFPTQSAPEPQSSQDRHRGAVHPPTSNSAPVPAANK